MQRKWISAVLWENPIKHVLNIHPDVFNSFYWTVTHGEFHRIYKEILLSMVTRIFRIWTSQQKSPKQIHVISTTAYHPPAIPRNNPRKHMNPVVNNYFSQFQPSSVATIQITTSKVYWSPQGRFLLFAPTSNYKVINVSP